MQELMVEQERCVEVEGSCQMGALMSTVIRPTSTCQCFMVYGSVSESSKLILLCVQTTVLQIQRQSGSGRGSLNLILQVSQS